MRPLRSSLLALTALTTVACTALLGDFEVTNGNNASSSSGDNGDGGNGEGGGGAVTVTPPEAKVGILRSQTFTASGGATWTVQEGEAGGTIDATGKYISPEKPGVYHVIATSASDPTKTTTVNVTVVPLGMSLVAGKPGGPGNLDGAANVARFRNPEGFGILQGSGGQDVMIVADTGNNTVRRFAGGKVTTLAGMPGVAGSADGTGAAARFDRPTFIATDSNGQKLFVLDSRNYCIRQIDPATGAVSTFAGQCTRQGSTDGDKASATIDEVESMIMGPKKTALYTCERNSQTGWHTVRRIALTGAVGSITTVISTIGVQNLAGCQLAPAFWPTPQVWIAMSSGNTDSLYVTDDGDTGLTPPVFIDDMAEVYTRGLAVHRGFGSADHVYALPQSNPFIYRYHISGASPAFTKYAGDVQERRHQDGPVADARFNSPAVLVSDHNTQSLHVVDRGSHTIRRIEHFSDAITTVLGSPANDTRIDGPRATARFTMPFAVTTDDSGQNIFVADVGFERPPNNTIRKYDTTAAVISTVSGVPYRPNPQLDPPVDGPKDAAKFGIPFDMVRLGGDLFVIDVLGQAVRRVNIASGEAKTIAGELNVAGNSDGVGALAHFKFFDPNTNDDEGFGTGIATDGTSLYVSDTANHQIRKIKPTTGEVTTIAGGTDGTANGIGKAAQFKRPAGLAVDGGFLYIADAGDGTIRRMDLATNEVTSFMGLSGVIGSKDGDATQATFFRPVRLAADGIGNLYLTETPALFFGISTIRRIDMKRRLASTFAGSPTQSGFAPGPLPGSLNCPSSIHVNAKGDLVFSDFCDGIIGIIQPL